jgi:hypothetical protein
MVWPAQTGLLLEAAGAAGAFPMDRFALDVACPQAFVTVNDSVGFPALAKHTCPGASVLAFAGLPPGKFHAQLVIGAPQSCTVADGFTH